MPRPHPTPRPQKVWAEFLRQCQLALLVIVGFMLLAWLVRRRPPWEGAVRTHVPGASGGAAAGAGAGGWDAADAGGAGGGHAEL